MSDYWEAPTDDFDPTDGYTNDDANTVASDIKLLHRGNGQGTTGTGSLAACTIAEDMIIDMTNQCFYATGASVTGIRRILYTDGTTKRIGGNVIWVTFGAGTTIYVGYSASGNYYPISGSSDIVVSALETIGFIFSGAEWFTLNTK